VVIRFRRVAQSTHILNAVKISTHPTILQRQIQARLKKTQAKGPVLAASLVTIHKRCGTPGCHCSKGKGHPGFYVTRKDQGKTNTTYIPQELLPQVRSWIQEHKRLKALLQEISQLSLAQIRTHVTARRLKAGRS
jgi:hypothetical protein